MSYFNPFCRNNGISGAGISVTIACWYQIKDDEMGEAGNTHGRGEGKYHSEDLDLDGTIC
jgi:hypothetical protein